MNYLSREFAERQATHDFKKYFDRVGIKALQFPIDPDRVAEIIWDTDVIYAEQGTLPMGTVACADLINNQIIIESSGYEPRDRFSIAHEVGHISLHTYLVGLGEVKADEYIFVESQADAYASVLLMPREYVLKCVDGEKGLLVTNDHLIRAVSDKFFVSKMAAQIRLENLKVIQNSNMKFEINKREKVMQNQREEWLKKDDL